MVVHDCVKSSLWRVVRYFPFLSRGNSRLSVAPQVATKPDTKEPVFVTRSLSCGVWEYRDSDSAPLFSSHYTETSTYQGQLLLGRTSAVLLLFGPTAYTTDQTENWKFRIDFAWQSIDTMFVSGGPNPNLVITCHHSPKMYRPERLGSEKGKKIRITALDDQHREIAAQCFSYQILLSNGLDLEKIRSQLQNGPEMPPTMTIRTIIRKATTPLSLEMYNLSENLISERQTLQFPVMFQATKLAMNGCLSPSTVKLLIKPLTVLIKSGTSVAACAYALYKLYNRLPSRGPHTDAKEFSVETITTQLQEFASNSLEGSVFQKDKRYGHLFLVYHFRVTPTGIYLEGPEKEVSNRVLRKHIDHLDSFVRVTFSEEDGERLDFQWNTNLDPVYARYKDVLNTSISICDKSYQFLGFSSSSLKSGTAWFMAPFWDHNEKKILFADLVIHNLGHFETFTSPAKCAARIGQAFTDTNSFVTINPTNTREILDVKQNGRVFSDGCGTISQDLADAIAAQYPRLVMRFKPIAFQVRYQGYKGMLSVDPSLGPGEIRLRDSMNKFQAKNTHDLEICRMADRALTLYLNRPLINVLEDLGVPEQGFLEMARAQIRDLQSTVTSQLNAAIFLETERVGDAAGLPPFLRRLIDVKIDLSGDRFLANVVEMAAFVRLRELKYKGRIAVKNGIKLVGVMDETGFLKEGEISCVWVNSEGRVHCLDRHVAITRSPTNHPGDVRVVRAVRVPPDSPLSKMYNCVVFSQHGERDLPSMLGGGDLDGDDYDVIWDPRLMPPLSHEPADYPRLPPIDIGRTVVTRDITEHFIDHMKNNNVGMLSSGLLVLSDHVDQGTMDDRCIEMAALISTALDFPKTGIKADMKKVPHYNKAFKPDFMAHGPRVKVGGLEALIEFEKDVKDSHDPVTQLDPDQRPTIYYQSEKVLGKLYREVDEKSFYESLQAQAQEKTKGPSQTMETLWRYLERATAGIQFSAYLDHARDIRHTYESNLNDTMHSFALHPSHPLHEVEVVSGCVLGSMTNRRLKEYVSNMKIKFAADVVYTLECIREDDDGSTEEALARSLACLAIALREPGMKVGKEGELRSFAYVAGAVCLQELEIFHGGLLKRY
ncbi:RdRP-domain-containing protein [Tothia fuscella]|uniref:RNA-dependent RNA polymerase n=1 Tax=Tothia fuscella TaxID=1048955 RepID=A0A9P4TY92_9PEZI|nr:RdRP-domain-containing protein [Tothia fuscella]